MSLTLPSTGQNELEEDFVKDVQVFCGDTHYPHLTEYVAEFLRANARPEAEDFEKIIKAFATSHPALQLPNVRQCFRLLKNLALLVADSDLTGRGILAEKEKILPSFEHSEETVHRLADVVGRLAPHRQELIWSQEREQRINGVLPMLSGWTTSLDARIIWQDKEEKTPVFVPLASILLGFDSGIPDKIGFQITPVMLHRLIEKLQQIEEQLRTAAASSTPTAP